jgi:hemolysin activation/secretion protein
VERPLWTAGHVRVLALGLFSLLFVFSLCYVTGAVAQILAPRPDQTVEPERRPGATDLTPRPPAVIEKEGVPEQRPKERGGPRVLVKKFRITGNTVFTTETLESLVRSEEGKELTLEELREVAARITDYYSAHDYILARAYLPPQDVREGIIEIAVMEGQVGKIEVTGNERYKSEVIARALTPVTKAKVVDEALLETAINELNDYPGLNVRASLKPGENRGDTDIVLNAEERLPLSVGLDVDNYGSAYTGTWRFGADLSYGNLTGLGDKLTLRGIVSDEHLWYGRASFVLPVGNYWTKAGVNYTYSQDGVGYNLSPLEAKGRLNILGFDIFQPILRTAGASFQFTGGFDYKNFTSYVEKDVITGSDQLSIFRLGFNGDYRDRLLGRTYYGVTYYQGFPWFGANPQNDPGATRPDNPGTFSIFTADLARVQSLGIGGSYLVLRGTGQWSGQNLQAIEQFAIGGYYTVRGFPLAQWSGDSGYAVTAELVVPVPGLQDWVQLVGFIDNGGVYLVSPNKAVGEKNHNLTGAGGGLRFNLPVPGLSGGMIQIRLDYGVRVTGEQPAYVKDGIKGDGSGFLYFSTSFRW